MSSEPGRISVIIRPYSRETRLPTTLTLVLIALFVACVRDARGDSDFVTKLKPLGPFPALRAAAETRKIPLDGIERSAETNALAPGDSVTALVTLHKKGRVPTQWLISFQATAGSKESPSKQPAPEVIHTSMGGKFEFIWHPTNIRIRTVGPFIEPTPERKPSALKDKSSPITVNQTFLGLGLDQATSALHRLFNSRDQTNGPGSFEFAVASGAFSSSQISRGQKMAALWHITPDEERALAGGVPALFTYFSTVQQTPELESILLKVLSRPSVWSIVKNVGVSVDIRIGSPRERVGPLHLSDWWLPSDSQLYSLPTEIIINKRRALTLTLIVTAPRPPFLACGGIVGFLAENPEDKDNYLTLRVISAHCRTPR